MQEAAVPDVYAKEDNCGGLPTISHLSLSEIQNALLADPCIREVIARLQTGETPSSTVRNALPRLPVPVYKVCPETQTGPIRTFHRNLILPCGTLPSEIIECESESPILKCKTRNEMTCRRSEGTDEIPDFEEEDNYCLMPQFELVNESFVVHTPEVAHSNRNNAVVPAPKTDSDVNQEIQSEISGH